MSKFDNVYEPEEDSQLLLDNALNTIGRKNNLKICEVGVGSGFVVFNLAKEKSNNIYYGTDVNPHAIEITNNEFAKIGGKIILKETNLLEGVEEKFDLILFNTPYLPLEDGENIEEISLKDRAIYGGKRGYEVIEEFILQVNDKLKENGVVLMVFSSFSNLKYIEEVLRKNLFEFEMIGEQKAFFEIMYCLKFWKSENLRKISKKIESISYLTKGKHSTILEGKIGNEEVIVKVGEFRDIQIEQIFLEKFQKEKFVPKLYFYDKEFIVMHKLNGKTIKDFLQSENDKEKIEIVLNEILRITQRLDELGVNKFELTNPYKHIFIDSDLSVKFIDFERMIYSDKPKNTTQFLQYLRRNISLLKDKRLEICDEKIMKVSKKYSSKRFEIKMVNLLTISTKDL